MMNIAGIGPSVPIDLSRTEAELREAAAEFESLVLETMLREMTEAQLDEGFFGGSAGSDTYDSMMTRYLSEHLAKDSPLGIADMLLEQWTSLGEAGPAEAREAVRRLAPRRAAVAYEDTRSGFSDSAATNTRKLNEIDRVGPQVSSEGADTNVVFEKTPGR